MQAAVCSLHGAKCTLQSTQCKEFAECVVHSLQRACHVYCAECAVVVQLQDCRSRGTTALSSHSH